MDQTSTSDEGRTLLAPLRDVEPSVRSSVDIARARTVGRRRQRNRIVASVAAVVVGVVVSAAVVSSWVHETMVPAVPSYYSTFDPLEQVVTVGSAGGFTPVSYQTGRNKQTILLVGSVGRATLTVYSATASKGMTGGFSEENGTSYTWQWTPGAWATVSVAQQGGGDIKARLPRVAESVLPQVHKQVTLPFTLPASLNKDLDGVTYDYQDSLAEMAFRLDDSPTAMSVGIAARGGLSQSDQIDGRPAYVNGNTVKMLDMPPQFSAFATDTGTNSETARLRTYAAAVRLVGDPNDRSTWTTPWRSG